MSRQLRRSRWLAATASSFAVVCGLLSAGAAAAQNPTQLYASPDMMRSTRSFAAPANTMSVYESFGYASPYFSLGRVCITRVPVYRYGNFAGFRCLRVAY
jgi:hypothetical protein